MADFDAKTATSQMHAPCIGGIADGKRIPLKPKVLERVEFADYANRSTTKYVAERMRAGKADLVIYRLESMSVEHCLFHLIRNYPAYDGE